MRYDVTWLYDITITQYDYNGKKIVHKAKIDSPPPFMDKRSDVVSGGVDMNSFSIKCIKNSTRELISDIKPVYKYKGEQII